MYQTFLTNIECVDWNMRVINVHYDYYDSINTIINSLDDIIVTNRHCSAKYTNCETFVDLLGQESYPYISQYNDLFILLDDHCITIMINTSLNIPK